MQATQTEEEKMPAEEKKKMEMVWSLVIRLGLLPANDMILLYGNLLLCEVITSPETLRGKSLKFCLTTDADFNQLVRMFGRLFSDGSERHLSVNIRVFCSEEFQPTDSDLTELSVLGPVLRQLEIWDSKHFTAELLPEFVSLEVLDLHGCEAVTDAGLRKLPTACVSLQSLNIGGCTAVTDYGIERLPDLKDLGHVDLSGCGGITVVGVCSLKWVPSLRSLNVSMCSGMTNGCMLLIAECIALQRLNLSFCENVTDVGAHALCKLVLLEKLGLIGCGNVSHDAKNYLRVCLPRCAMSM
jgi:hypothetical protein